MRVLRIGKNKELCLDVLRLEIWQAAPGCRVDELSNGVLLFYSHLDVEKFEEVVGAVLDGHDGAAENLRQAKEEKKADIDAKTSELILGGFSFDGRDFSMSLSAQTNWLGVALLQKYPRDITDRNDEAYTLTAEKAPEFLALAEGAKEPPLAWGGELKQQVNAAATVEQVLAIKDNRGSPL